MKTTTRLLIILGILIFVFLIFNQTRGCYEARKSKQLSEIEGRLQSYQEETAKKEAEMSKALLEREKKIEALERKNEVLKSESDEINKQIIEKSKKIKELEREGEILENKDQIIFNLKAQVKEWQDQFSLAIKDRDNWKEQALNYKVALYKAELSVEELKENLQRKDNIIKTFEGISIEKDKKIKRLELTFTLKNVLYTGGGFLFGYLLGGAR